MLHNILKFFEKISIPRVITLTFLTWVMKKSVYGNLSGQFSNGDLKPQSDEITENVNQIARKMNISHPVKVYTAKHARTAEACGINGPGKMNNMAILLSPDMQDKPFVIAHELAHLKYNDPLTIVLTNSVFIGFLGMFSLQNLAFKNLLTIYLFAYGIIAVRRHQEKRADLIAAEHTRNRDITWFVHALQADDFSGNTRSITGALLNMYCRSVDTHPSHSTRVEYLSDFMVNRPDSDSTIKVFYQTNEDAPLNPLPLSKKQSAVLHKIIHDSPKKRILAGLEKIILFPNQSKANVQLFFYNDDQPRPYDFETPILPTQKLLPAIIKAIAYSDAKNIVYVNFDKSSFNENKVKKAHEEMNLTGVINTIEVNKQPDHSKRHFVMYSEKPLTLVNDKKDKKKSKSIFMHQ